MNTETILLLEKANRAIFEAEQAIRKEEKAQVNKPMYRMRINLNEIIQHYKNGGEVCDFVTPLEMAGRL